MLGSSVAEQVTVNHLVAGSNPARAAIFLTKVYGRVLATSLIFDVMYAY